MSGFDWSNFGNSRRNDGVSKTIENEFGDVNRIMKQINEDLMFDHEKKTEKSPLWFKNDLDAYTTKWPPITAKWPLHTQDTENFLTDFNKKLDEYRVEQTPRFRTYYSNAEILGLAAGGVACLLVLLLIIFSIVCSKKRTQSGIVVSTGRVFGPGAVQQNQQLPMTSPGQGGPVPSTGRVFGPGAVQQNQQLPMRSPGQGGAVPSNIGVPYSNRTSNEDPPSYPRQPMVYNNGLPNESGKDSVKIQMKLDEVDGLTKETELPLNPTTQSGNEYPIRFDDDFYAYRKSTKWPPISKSWPRMDPMTPSTESPNSIIIADFNKKLDHALDDFDYKMSNQQERLNYYNNDFANRLKKIDFDLKIVSPKRTHVHTYKGPLNVFVTIGSGVGIILLLILIIYSARKKKSIQPGTVLSTGRVPEQGAVQQNQEIPMMAPGHGGAVPPNIGMPYSNKTFNEEPPPYPGDTVPLINNNAGFVEMGFQNEGVAIPTAANLKTEFVTESGKTVESLNVGTKKDGAGQGTRRSDDY